jgi:hypothetical protein
MLHSISLYCGEGFRKQGTGSREQGTGELGVYLIKREKYLMF